MIARRLLLTGAALVTAASATVAVAPSASADLACAWVDPHGICIVNPFPALPRLPLP